VNILGVRIRSRTQWAELYQDGPGAGALFVPTTTSCIAGDEVVVEVDSALLPNKVLIRGVVAWWRPAVPRQRVRAGGLVTLATDGASKRDFVRDVMTGERPAGPRRRQGRLPVSLAARYRLPAASAWHDVDIVELSSGGALLATATPLALDTELTVEIPSPGATSPHAIAARVGYHGTAGATGVRFLCRDVDGTRRLRELVRRVRAA